MKAVDYEKKYEDNLKDIVLKKAEGLICSVFLFGSRAAGKSRWGSDYDIGISGLEEDLFFKLKRDINDEVEESLIPWSVDVVHFDSVTDRFRNIAMESVIWWKKS